MPLGATKRGWRLLVRALFAPAPRPRRGQLRPHCACTRSARQARRPQRRCRVNGGLAASPLRVSGARQNLGTQLYPSAASCNPCYLVLPGIGCAVAGPVYSTAARVPRFSSSFLGGPAPSVADAASPPQSYSLAPNRTQKTPWAPASALCCYPKPPASRGDARALHEV